MAVQTAARTYEGVVVGLGRGQPALRRTGRPHHPATDLAGPGRRLGTTDYTELGLPGGHIGMLGTTKSRGIVGKGTVDWLVERDS